MHLIEIFALALALAMDAFAVAVTTGVRMRCTFSAVFRMSFMFGLFQFLMPVIGWVLGNSVRSYIESFDHWIAFALLCFVGVRMVLEAIKNPPAEECIDPTKGITLVVLAIATSLDALAVGLSIAILGVDIWFPAIVIGLVCFSVTALGMQLGVLFTKNSTGIGRWANCFGGLVLLGIGFKILIEHNVF